MPRKSYEECLQAVYEAMPDYGDGDITDDVISALETATVLAKLSIDHTLKQEDLFEAALGAITDTIANKAQYNMLKEVQNAIAHIIMSESIIRALREMGENVFNDDGELPVDIDGMLDDVQDWLNSANTGSPAP